MATAPRVLRHLKIDEVSSVDRGAGRGVKVVMMKRHGDGVPDIYGKPLAFAPEITADAEEYLKREFTQDERDAAAGSGAAMPDGSFPIKSKADLKNAIAAIGRAKNPAKAKAHIKERARALGAEDMLPEGWTKRDAAGAVIDIASWVDQLAKAAGVHKDALDFDEAAGRIEAAETAGALMSELSQAMCALDCAIRSILEDEQTSEKGAKISESFAQFKEHLASLSKRAEDDDAAEDGTMTTKLSPEVQKMIDDAVAAASKKAAEDAVAPLAKSLAEKDAEIAILKMSDKHKKFHDSLSSDDAKKKFAGMTADERDAHMQSQARKYADDPVIKAQAEENATLKKRIQDLEDKDALALAKADARELGMTAENCGEILMKSRRGDPDAHKQFEAYVGSLQKQLRAAHVSGKIFNEIGKGGGPGGGGSSGSGGAALDEINAMATALKAQKPDLSFQQAYAKVASDPANAELVARESQERLAKIQKTAA